MKFSASQCPRKRVCVLIADANAMSCRLLAEGLQRHRNLEIVACPLNSSEFVTLVEHYAFDVALISAQSGSAAYETIPRIHEHHPSARIVLLLERSDREAVVEAFRAGASGVFCRSAYTLKSLRRCIESVARGQVWANSKELGYVLDDYRQTVPVRATNPEAVEPLTAREKDVYRLVAEGLSNRDVADQLGLSERTVKNYLFHIFDKLGISTRVELVLHATAHDREKSVRSASAFEQTAPLSSSAD